MKTAPIRPARIDFADPPRAPDFDDGYHPRIGAFEQARHVFLGGNGLPARWAGRPDFTIVETGFGLGNNFLATWQAWRADAARCERLHFVSIERHPPCADDLTRAHRDSPAPELAAALVAAWPPLTPNLHVLDFDGGRVRLLLALGDVTALLPTLRAEADAFYLDGFTPARNPEMWQPRVLKALARMAAPEATLATWSAARTVRDGLVEAGFEVQRVPGIGGKFDITLARFAPRFVPQRHAAPHARSAIVIGAGIAGAATAAALAELGVAVTVLDRHAAPAAQASGNPAALFHGTVHADDGRHARLFRAAALVAARRYAPAGGMLRLGDELPRMQALLARQGLPADYVQALPPAAASALAGVPLARPAWFYPGGGAIAPADTIARLLSAAQVRFQGGADAAALRREGDDWQVLDAQGAVIASAHVVVLANAADAQALLLPLGHAAWPLSHSRGQVTFNANAPSTLRLPLAGDGYAIPLPGGGLLCGATHEADAGGAAAPELRQADQRHNFERLQRLTGAVPEETQGWSDRSGWRLHSADRLPIAGALPLPQMPPGQRLDQARLLPREPGLFVLTALGGRGFTLAPLLGRLIAAQATGTPWPLEQDLADAVDPARWRVRAARKPSSDQG